jgi:hypothetical protein
LEVLFLVFLLYLTRSSLNAFEISYAVHLATQGAFRLSAVNVARCLRALHISRKNLDLSLMPFIKKDTALFTGRLAILNMGQSRFPFL